MTVRSSLGAAARRAIELLSHNVVLRRRLPAELGGHTIYVAPDASLRFWVLEPYEVDPLLLALAREIVREGDVVWDIGANVGLFSIAAAHFARQQGRVVAVEPDPWLATLVRRSARRLPPTFAPIEVVEAAVSNSTGVASFAVAARARAASHLDAIPGSSQTGGVRYRLSVPTISLDDLLAVQPPPRLVKIDVEGAELLCLAGATKLLAEVRPLLLCEVTADAAEDVGRLLHRFDYTLTDARLPRADRLPIEKPTWDTLAIPGPPA